MTIQTIYDQVLAGEVEPIVWRAYASKRAVVVAYWTWRIRRSDDGVYHYLGEDFERMRRDFSHDPALFADVCDHCFETIEYLNGYTNISYPQNRTMY